MDLLKRISKNLALTVLICLSTACASHRQISSSDIAECVRISDYPRGNDERDGQSVYQSCVDGRSQPANENAATFILVEVAAIVFEVLLSGL